jgi:hypothetical protein
LFICERARSADNSHKYGRSFFPHTTIFISVTKDELIREEYHPKYFLAWRFIIFKPLQTFVMNEPFDKNTFDTWKKNLKPDANLPVCTTDALIDLTELENFISDIKVKGAKSIRVNLVRFNWKDNEPQKIKEKDDNHPIGCKWNLADGTNTSQVGIVINGADQIIRSADYTLKANDIFEANGDVRLLIPGGRQEGPSGHNPPGPVKRVKSGG